MPLRSFRAHAGHDHDARDDSPDATTWAAAPRRATAEPSVTTPTIAWLVHPSDLAPLCHAQPAHAPYPIALTSSEEAPARPLAAAPHGARQDMRALDASLLDCGVYALVSPRGSAYRCQVYGLALTAEEWLDLTFQEALDRVAGSIERIRAASGAACIGVGAWTALHPSAACLQSPPPRWSPRRALSPAPAGALAALHLHAHAGGLQILDLPGAMGRAAAIQFDRHADPLLLLDPAQLSAEVLTLAWAFTDAIADASKETILGTARIPLAASQPSTDRAALPVPIARPHPPRRTCPVQAACRRHGRIRPSPRRVAPRQRLHPA